MATMKPARTMKPKASQPRTENRLRIIKLKPTGLYARLDDLSAAKWLRRMAATNLLPLGHVLALAFGFNPEKAEYRLHGSSRWTDYQRVLDDAVTYFGVQGHEDVVINKYYELPSGERLLVKCDKVLEWVRAAHIGIFPQMLQWLEERQTTFEVAVAYIKYEQHRQSVERDGDNEESELSNEIGSEEASVSKPAVAVSGPSIAIPKLTWDEFRARLAKHDTDREAPAFSDDDTIQGRYETLNAVLAMIVIHNFWDALHSREWSKFIPKITKKTKPDGKFDVLGYVPPDSNTALTHVAYSLRQVLSPPVMSERFASLGERLKDSKKGLADLPPYQKKR